MPVCRRKTTIGGQAIIEGIVMKGPKRPCWSSASRTARWTFRNGTAVSLEKHPFWKLPICRGAYSLFTAMKDGWTDIDYSAKFYDEEGQRGRTDQV